MSDLSFDAYAQKMEQEAAAASRRMEMRNELYRNLEKLGVEFAPCEDLFGALEQVALMVTRLELARREEAKNYVQKERVVLD